AAIRRDRAGQQVDQRGLAGAVRPDDADAIAALYAERETVDDSAVVPRLADALGLDHQPAGFFRLRRDEIGAARGAFVGAPLLAQCMQIAEPFDIALAPAGDAVAQPVLLVDDLAVQLVLVALFLRQHVVAPGLEGGKAAID